MTNFDTSHTKMELVMRPKRKSLKPTDYTEDSGSEIDEKENKSNSCLDFVPAKKPFHNILTAKNHKTYTSRPKHYKYKCSKVGCNMVFQSSWHRKRHESSIHNFGVIAQKIRLCFWDLFVR